MKTSLGKLTSLKFHSCRRTQSCSVRCRLETPANVSSVAPTCLFYLISGGGLAESASTLSLLSLLSPLSRPQQLLDATRSSLGGGEGTDGSCFPGKPSGTSGSELRSSFTHQPCRYRTTAVCLCVCVRLTSMVPELF